VRMTSLWNNNHQVWSKPTYFKPNNLQFFRSRKT